MNPLHHHEREYWVQVEGAVTDVAMQQLQSGVTISVNGAYKTLPCKVQLFQQPPNIPLRNPPIRFRRDIPDCWMRMVLHEGKNRQVRKMTAKVGFPTLRLVRYRIEKVTLGTMQPGDMQEVTEQQLNRLLFAK